MIGGQELAGQKKKENGACSKDGDAYYPISPTRIGLNSVPYITLPKIIFSPQVAGGEELAGPEEEEVGAGSQENMEEVLGVSEGNHPTLL